MRVAMLIEPGRIELREVERPVPAAGALLLRVRAALTDGTDVKAYRRGHPQMPMPTRFGHELSGDVVQIGAGVASFAVGDAVMCVHSAPCDACFWCARGQEELCETVMSTKILGAYGEYIEIPSHIVTRNCFTKPVDLSYIEAAFLEPLACVVHSIAMLALQSAEFVAVMGDGGFGLLHALVLAERGVRVVLVGRRAERLAIAASLGIDAVDARCVSPAEAILAHSDGRGADALIECTGRRDVWEAAPLLVRRGGHVALFGGLPADARVSFSAARLHYDEVRLFSPFHFTPRAVRAAYELLAHHRIAVRPLITDVVPLARIGEVFARLDAGDGVKFAIEP